MLKKRFIWVFPLVVVVFLFLIVPAVQASTPTPEPDPEAGEAASATTHKFCDTDVKYYCMWVRHKPAAPGQSEIRKRMFKGAIDAGAIEWQPWFAKDWDCTVPPTCSLIPPVWVWPSTNWFTNVIMPGSGKKNLGNMVTVPTVSAVTMRTRFKSDLPPHDIWCGISAVFYLQTGDAIQFAAGGCAADGP